MFDSLIRNRRLFRQFTARQIATRYRGSAMGFAWSFITPLLMLLVYTFVFGVVLKARFGATGSTFEFALFLYSGLIMHAFLAECINRSAGLIVGNSQYVKKVVFPLDLLGWSTAASAGFQALVSTGILLIFILLSGKGLTVQAFLVPVVFLPLVFFGLGISWFISSTVVYIRDIGQVTGVLATLLLFLSPIFYPLERVPEAIRPFMGLNPLSYNINQFREILLYDGTMDWPRWFIQLAAALIFAALGYRWFHRLKPGFSDVI